MTLHRRKILKGDQNLACPLCGIEKETTDHLLIHCSWSWKVCGCCLNWWGSKWAMPHSVDCLLESWEVGGASNSFKRFWKTLYYAILWPIWEERNKRCFQDQIRLVEDVVDQVKVSVACGGRNIESPRAPIPWIPLKDVLKR
ncbi:hypothetical protein QQ045_024250 [Rhodiola kirilowii]